MLLALQGAHVADVASGRVAVVPQHLVLVLRALPLREVTQGPHQGVPREHRQLQVVLHVLVAQRHLALQTRFKGQSFLLRTEVAEDAFSLLVLLTKTTCGKQVCETFAHF